MAEVVLNSENIFIDTVTKLMLEHYNCH